MRRAAARRSGLRFRRKPGEAVGPDGRKSGKGVVMVCQAGKGTVKKACGKTCRMALLLVLALLLTACKVEMYTGLTEEQANEMLSTLLKRGIAAEKASAGKTGYTLSVESDELVRSLQILRENSLPRESFRSLGDVFSGQSMIASASEDQARMAYALSQELSDTFSRIDGVLTARVHVVLGVHDPINDVVVEPSAAVFLRHTPESPVVNLVPNIREVAARAVAGLKYDNVAVMLVPVRESVTVPQARPEYVTLFTPRGFNWLLLVQLAAVSLVLLGAGIGAALLVRRLRARRKAEPAPESEG